MAHSISKSASGKTTAQLQWVAIALFIWTLLSTLGIYYRLNRAASHSKLERDTASLQNQAQQLTQLAQTQVALPVGSQSAVQPAITDSINNIDQSLNADQSLNTGALQGALKAEWNQLVATWIQLKADFEPVLSGSDVNNVSAATSLATSENFAALSQQVSELAEVQAQQYRQRTMQLLWVVLAGYLGVIAYLLHTMQQLQKNITTKTRTMADLSNELSVTIEKQSQPVFEQGDAVSQVKATLKQLEDSARQTTAQANTAVASATEALQRNKNIIFPVQEALKSTLSIANQADSMDKMLSQLNGQTDDISAVAALFSDFSHRIGMLSLSSSLEEIRAKTHGQELVWVSDEVRSLSAQSQNISQEVQQLVSELKTTLNHATALSHGSLTTTQSGIESAQNIAHAFEKMEEADDQIVVSTQQFSLLLEQQFDAVSQVLDTLTIIDQNSQEMVSSFTEAQETAHQLQETLRLLEEIT